MTEQPKIIIDTDWKSQAQAEKERLAAASKPASPAAPAGVGAGAAGGMAEGAGPAARQPGEGVKFEDLVGLLTTQALSFMGAYPDPRTGQAVVALDLAKLHIDLLSLLEQKTKGNLNDTEQKMLSQTVHELRLEFVDLTKAIAKAVQEGKISPQQLGAMGAGGLGAIGASAMGASGMAGPGIMSGPGGGMPPSMGPGST